MILFILKLLCELFLFALIGYIIYIILEQRRCKSTLKGYFPTYPGLPGFLGHIHLALYFKNTGDMLNYITEACKNYKNGCIIWLGHVCFIGILDIDMIDAVLSSNETVHKAYVYDILSAITRGIFVMRPAEWRPLRKKLNTTMSAKLMDNYLVKMNEEAATLVDVLASRVNKTVNVIEYIQPYFFDIITSTHVGISTTDQVDRKLNFTYLGSKCSEILISQCGLKPYLYYNQIYEMSPYRKQLDVYRKPFVRTIEMLFRTRLEAISKNPELKSNTVYADLVHDYLQERNITPNVKNVARYSGDMVLAGSDTSSVATSTLFYFLARDQIWQEKIYQEVSEIYGDCKHRELTKSDLNRMIYLEMCIKEALRLSSPPGVLRHLTQDFDTGKCILPKRSMLYIILSAVHRNPDYYERPNEFYPNHFLPENVNKRPKLAFIPFSYGPRNCPGFQYALLAMKCATSAIINNYHLSSDLLFQDVKQKFVFLREFVDGYPIKLVPRKCHC